jgi:mobilization protein NikA
MESAHHADVTNHTVHARCQYLRIDNSRKHRNSRRMKSQSKSSQLQIRVSPSEKVLIQRAAKRAGTDMSSYVLSRLISVPATRFQECISAAAGPKSSFGLAELNKLLTSLSSVELREAVASAPAVALSPFIENYAAAMVELACARRTIPVPRWTRAVAPLGDPWFANKSPSLRHYLLTVSPASFRRRNIFIDSSLGSMI